VGRILLTLLGLSAIAGGAVYIAHKFVGPAHDKVEANKQVLTEAYKPKLVGCRALDDGDLPPTLERPGVDEDVLYVEVVLLYPGVDRVPQPLSHRLLGVNGEKVVLDPVAVDYAEDEEGTYLTLVFKADNSFQHARLFRDEELLVDRVDLE
jgi:hypothetical protein